MVQGQGRARSRTEMTPKPFVQCLTLLLPSVGCFVSGDRIVKDLSPALGTGTPPVQDRDKSKGQAPDGCQTSAGPGSIHVPKSLIPGSKIGSKRNGFQVPPHGKIKISWARDAPSHKSIG